jgi:multidrug resistance efflux pump
MGWGRFLLLGNLGQQLDLSEQRREVDDLRDELRRMRRSDANATTLAELRAENDELRLYLTALMRLLAAKGVVTREELEQIVAAIDAEDGERDGGRRGPVG